jgi:hypothetical protein
MDAVALAISKRTDERAIWNPTSQELEIDAPLDVVLDACPANVTLTMPPALGPVVNVNLLSDDAKDRPQDVIVVVAFIVFLVDAAFWFTCPTMLSCTTYYIYRTHTMDTIYWSIPITSIGSVVLLSYIVLALLPLSQEDHVNMACCALLVFMISFMPLVGIAAAMLGNISLLQLCCIYSTQSLVVVLMTEYSRHEIDVLASTVCMALGSLVVWCIGLYAFIKESDWLSSILVFVFGAVGAAYRAHQLGNLAPRFDSATVKKMDAIRCFYTDPIRFLWAQRTAVAAFCRGAQD